MNRRPVRAATLLAGTAFLASCGGKVDPGASTGSAPSDLPPLDPACDGCYVVNAALAGDSASELFVAGYITDTNETFLREYDGNVWITYRLSGGPEFVDLLWGSRATGLYGAIGASLGRFDFDRFQFGPREVDASSVWGSGASDVFAADLDVVHHFDGTTWRDETPGTEHLRAVSGTSANDVVTVALHGRLARFDGRAWQVLAGTFDDQPLHHVWSRAPGDVYAIAGTDGADNGGTGGGLVAHHDGFAWTVAFDAPDDALLAITGVPGGNIYAVGAHRSPGGDAIPIVIRYDGVAWKRIEVPNANAFLWDAHCLPSGACYAVGTANTFIALHLL